MESLLLQTVASERCQMFAAIVRHECSFSVASCLETVVFN